MRRLIRLLILLIIAASLSYIFLVKEKEYPPERKTSEKLATLSYLTWVPAHRDIDQIGVVRYVPAEAYPGFNLYNSRDLAIAQLIDMNGNIIHRWQADQNNGETWHHIKACANGDLMTIVRERALLRLDWNSRLKWRRNMRFHHDMAVDETGDIYTIASKEKFVFRAGLPFPVLVDYIVVLSAAGQVKKEISIYSLLKDLVPAKQFLGIYRWLTDTEIQAQCRTRRKEKGYYLPMGSPPDILHTNALEVIPRTIKGLCEKGDLLISMRELDTIAIIDIRREELLWHWGPGVLEKQHQPTLLDNGHILVFDNGERQRKYSRVLEIDPVGRRIVWQYRARPPHTFFSVSRGGNQRLPNGNTLITESDRARVFEVTPAGKIVWEFFNPRTQPDRKRRAAIYRLVRLWDKERYPFLENLTAAPEPIP